MKKYNSFWGGVFLVIVLLIPVFPLFNIMAKSWEKNAAENWTKTFGPIEDLPKRYPYRNDNEPAVQLKHLANRLGIEFSVPGDSQRYSPLYVHAKRFRLLNGHDGLLSSYIGRQLKRPDETVDCPSDPLASYLFDYENELEVVRNHILVSPPILWRQNLNDTNKEHDPDTAMPRLLGILELQKVLVAHALELKASRRYQEAETYLEAAWKLNESLRTRSELLSQLIALSIDHHLLGLMRKLPVDTYWLQWIGKHDYEKAFVKGFMVETWLLWRLRNEVHLSESSMLNEVFNPYVLSSVAYLVENERQEIQRIQATNPCSLGYDDFYEFQSSQFPEWNRIQRSWLMFDKNYTYGRITKIKIDRELTAKIIQVRHGYFPQESSEWSTACQDGLWVYQNLPDGATSIEYGSRLEVPNLSWLTLPTSFTVASNNER